MQCASGDVSSHRTRCLIFEHGRNAGGVQNPQRSLPTVYLQRWDEATTMPTFQAQIQAINTTHVLVDAHPLPESPKHFGDPCGGYWARRCRVRRMVRRALARLGRAWIPYDIHRPAWDEIELCD